MLPAVYVSTGPLGLPPREAVDVLAEGDVLAIEFSGGPSTPHSAAVVEEQARSGLKVQVHNYFPPPPDPFVFNLCDPSAETRDMSRRLALDAIELTSQVGATHYSFHAGFRCSPQVGHLGSPWPSLEMYPLADALEVFGEEVTHLQERASDLGVTLLVENNILTMGTLAANGPDVLLMVGPDDIAKAFEFLPDKVGLLLDVAHLEVSAHTLGIDPTKALTETQPFTRAYHLSGTDTHSDLAMPVTDASWFWAELRPDIEYVTLEVSPRFGQSLSSQVALTTRKLQAGHE
jgi:sugar phosphate isomerase/epimerase